MISARHMPSRRGFVWGCMAAQPGVDLLCGSGDVEENATCASICLARTFISHKGRESESGESQSVRDTLGRRRMMGFRSGLELICKCLKQKVVDLEGLVQVWWVPLDVNPDTSWISIWRSRRGQFGGLRCFLHPDVGRSSSPSPMVSEI